MVPQNAEDQHLPPSEPPEPLDRPVRTSAWRMAMLSSVMLVIGVAVPWAVPRYCEYNAQVRLQGLSRYGGPSVVISAWPAGPQWLESLAGNRMSWLPRRVTSISFANLELSDADLGRLAMLRHVQFLTLENVTFSGETVRFPRLPHLRQLCVTRVANCEPVLASYAGSPMLTELTLAHTEADESVFLHLSNLQGLKKLAFVDVPLDGAKLRLLPLRALEQFCLRKTNVANLDLALLADCTELQHLDLTGNRRVGDAGLWPIRSLPRLEVLLLSGTSVTDAGVIQLRHLPRLRRLSLSQTAVTLAGLMELDGSPTLRHLNPPFARPSDDWNDFPTLLPNVTLYEYDEDDEYEDIPRNFIRSH